MESKSKRQMMLLGGVLLFVLVMLVYQTIVKDKQAGTLAPDIAVARALISASAYNGVYGGLRGKPTEIYGKLMTYKESNDLLTGRPIAPDSLEIELADKQVWFILFQGDIIEIVPAAADGSVPEKQVQHSQMTVVLDAFTGDSMRVSMLSPQKKFDVRTLTELPYPDESSFEAFPTLPIQTAAVPLPPATPPAN